MVNWPESKTKLKEIHKLETKRNPESHKERIKKMEWRILSKKKYEVISQC